MKGINEQGTTDIMDSFVDAKTLLSMTISNEDVYQRTKDNFCESIMEAMVKGATFSAQKSYAVRLLEDLHPRMVEDLKSTFSKLGYNIQISELQKSEELDKNYRVMNIVWKDV